MKKFFKGCFYTILFASVFAGGVFTLDFIVRESNWKHYITGYKDGWLIKCPPQKKQDERT